MKTCSITGCEKTAHARTFCITHYSRWRTGRDLTAPYRLQDRDDDVRFDAAVEMDPNGGCWLWSAATSDFGHGVTSYAGQPIRAHRRAYERWRGPIPAELKVCHHCDVPQCVNPDHLFLGTQADNLADMVRKGRWGESRTLRGAANGNSRLTEAEALQIIADVAAGRSKTEVANDNGITRTAVYLIVKGQNWSHLQQRSA